jgi:hypothetical protein
MGNREWDKAPWFVSFSERWASPGEGRFWKRRLSKARRRYVRALLKCGRGKEPVGIESTVNWKNW